MKKLICLIFILPLCAFSKERKVASAEFELSKNCSSELLKNPKLQAMLRTIKLNVQEYQADSNNGYSYETGKLLIQMACKPYDLSKTEKPFDLCKDIENNVTAYQEDPQNGFSLETAKILDRMAGKNCLAQ